MARAATGTAGSLLLVLLMLHACTSDCQAAWQPGCLESRPRMPKQAIAVKAWLPSWYSNGGQVEWQQPWMGIPQPNIKFGPTGQDKEDLYAYNHFFHRMMGGSYLEIGGLDGLHLSNTAWLHRRLAWRGVLIEANPLMYYDMIKNRPADIGIHTAVCQTISTVHYANSGPVGGILEFMSEAFKQRWHPNTTKDSPGLEKITCLPLGAVLDKFGVSHVNFFSLDVEGAELAVLSSIDFSRFSFDVMVVEADGTHPTQEQAIKDLLEKHGYKLNVLEGRNNWFMREGFVPSAAPPS